MHFPFLFLSVLSYLKLDRDYLQKKNKKEPYAFSFSLPLCIVIFKAGPILFTKKLRKNLMHFSFLFISVVIFKAGPKLFKKLRKNLMHFPFSSSPFCHI